MSWPVARRLTLLLTTSMLVSISLGRISNSWDMVVERCSPFGVRIDYYKGNDFTHNVKRTYVRNLDQRYMKGKHPVSELEGKPFSTRWKTHLFAPATGEYFFYSQSRHGIRVWIDDQLLIDRWMDTPWDGSGWHGKMHLEAGLHPLRIEHYSKDGYGGVKLKWAGEHLLREDVVRDSFLTKH